MWRVGSTLDLFMDSKGEDQDRFAQSIGYRDRTDLTIREGMRFKSRRSLKDIVKKREVNHG